MVTNRVVGACAALILGVGFLAPQAAQAAPDFEHVVIVPQADGAFSATKTARVYLDNNPEDPFPGDGEVTYVYSLLNDAGSFVALNSFLINIMASCPITGMGYFPGTGDHDPDAPGGEFFPPADPNGTVRWNFNPPGGISPGQSSSEMYVTSACAPGTGTDTIISVGGEFGFDASSPCLGPMVMASCDLELEKSCAVDQPPTGGQNDCQGAVKKMVFEYTGDACSATTNYQNGKLECTGDPAHAQPVKVKEFLSNIRTAPHGEVLEIGDRVRMRAVSGEFPTNTPLWIKQHDAPIQDLIIHTSCSEQLNVGDQFGALKLVKLNSTHGGLVKNSTPPAPTDPNSGSNNACEVAGAPLGTECGCRPTTMAIRYVGGDCSETTNDQLGTLVCNGDAGTTQPVRVVLEDGSANTYLDTGVPADTSLGDILEASAVLAGESKFATNSIVRILDSMGTQLQEIEIHTSCSKPLAIGDRFGAVQIVGFDDISFGDDVHYTYEVTNPNLDEVTNVTITDDKISNIVCPALSIPAGETMTCTADQFISMDTMNMAEVHAETVGGTVCDPAFSGANVTITEIDVNPTKKKKKKTKSKKKTKKKVSKHRHNWQHSHGKSHGPHEGCGGW